MYKQTTGTIANGAAITGSIELTESYLPACLITDSAWDTNTITFQASTIKSLFAG